MAGVQTTDLAYAAGIIDGEGSFVISEWTDKRNGGSRRHSPQHRMVVVVNMTDFEVPMWLHQTFGGSLRTYDYKPGRERPYARWVIQGAAAADLCELLIPYLIAKQKQAELAMNFWRNRKITPKGGVVMPDDEIARRREAMYQMRDLNQRRVAS